MPMKPPSDKLLEYMQALAIQPLFLWSLIHYKRFNWLSSACLILFLAFNLLELFNQYRRNKGSESGIEAYRNEPVTP